MRKPQRIAVPALTILPLLLLAGACDRAKDKAEEAKKTATELTESAKNEAADLTAAAKAKAAEVASTASSKTAEIAAGVQQEGKAMADAAGAKTAEISHQLAAERDTLVRDAQHRLGVIDARISALADQASQASGESKKSLRGTLEDLRKKRVALHDKLVEFGNNGGAAWDDLVAGLKAAEQELDKALQKAQSRLK